mgnify:CR=1 FL=1
MKKYMRNGLKPIAHIVGGGGGSSGASSASWTRVKLKCSNNGMKPIVQNVKLIWF